MLRWGGGPLGEEMSPPTTMLIPLHTSHLSRLWSNFLCQCPHQVMNPVAQGVAVDAWMMCVPRSLSLSPRRLLLQILTGEKQTLLQPTSATPCSQRVSSALSWHCRDCADNPGFWSDETAFQLFEQPTHFFSYTLGQWTMPQKLTVFYEKSSTALCLPFCFPKEYRVSDWTASSFLCYLWGPCLFQRILTQIFRTRRFSYLHLLLCCRSKGISRCESSPSLLYNNFKKKKV